MKNQTLPIPLSPTAIAPAPAKVTPQPNSDGAAFSQTLNREMAQRQYAAADRAHAPAPMSPPTPTAVAPRPAQQAKPAAPSAPAPKPAAKDDTAAPDTSDAAPDDAAAPAGDAAATATVKAEPDASATAATAAAAAAEGAAAAAPMTDMLALVASYQKLLQGGASATATKADTAATATSLRGTGIAADTQTLAALQTALKTGDGAKDTANKPAALATAPADDDKGAAVTPRDLAAAASRTAPQSEPALSSLRDAATTATLKDTAPVTGSAFQAQLSSAEMLQTAVTPGSDRIPARLGTTAWDNQVSQKVVWMVGGLDQTASLTLNPPDLGPVQVVLNVNNDQATVSFSSATPEVRAALENAMPRLREMLSDAGVTLGEANVSANLPDQRQADTGQGEGRNRGNGGNGAGVRSGETEIALPRTATGGASTDGAVDTFA